MRKFVFLFAVFQYLSTVCSVDIDATLSVPQLIQKYGYPVEVYHVTNKDKYILELHRIPYGKECGPSSNKTMVFVQHGLLSSSADWIIAGPKDGLGYILADKCYDVWMGNARGNKYSRRHEVHSPDSSKFWDFSWHEIGIDDLPTMIDFALSKSGQKKTFYIGHSQGTTSFFVMCSERPEYNSKIIAQFSLAPIAYMSDMTSPLLQIISNFEGPLSILLDLIGIDEFLPSTSFLALAGELFCSESSLTQFLCTNSLFVLCGFNEKNMNTELLPVIMGHTPAGSSTKQMLHYAQEIKSGKFRQYDYGKIKNLLVYKSLNPPNYDLSKVTAPVALFYSKNDWLAGYDDVMTLYHELGNPYGLFLVSDSQFNHLDYMWGLNVRALVYDKVIKKMAGFK